MTLAAGQHSFIAEITASDEGCAPSSLGMGIYRNAYRARLLGALETSFERTKRWVGDDVFGAAAAHYVLAYPPSSWTLDAYGAGFPALLAKLFAQDGEVAELAWLEWHLQLAFGAPDLPEVTPHRLATAGLVEEDWEQLRFTMAAGFAARPIRHDCTGLWQALRETGHCNYVLKTCAPGVLIVWRQALSPNYRVLGRSEFTALEYLVNGGQFGGAVALSGDDPAQFGAWFAQWLSEGLFSDFSLRG